MPRRHHLLVALSGAGFRRLYATRLAAQFGDGVFQASLAGTVLFNPERQAHASDVAAGFAVLLLPYSVIGPFAGVLLDRWWRQRVLTVTNAVRTLVVLVFAAEVAAGVSGVAFYASALLVISLGRFVLSALSAALPRVVPDSELVTANALSATSGSLVTAAGGASAIGIRTLLGGSNADYATIAAGAALFWLLSAAVARGFGRRELGPSAAERTGRETLGAVAHGLVAGARHAWSLQPVRYAGAIAGLHRLGYGITSVCTLLLFRNYFHSDGIFRSGLPGLATVVLAVAAGGAVAAMITPTAFRHVGPVRWPSALLALAAVAVPACGLPYRIQLAVLVAFVLGFAGQSIKISVDTVVQHEVIDAFRGRVFSLYDTMFNLALVAAAVLTATVLPESGRSPVAVVSIGAGYALTAIGYVVLAGRANAQPVLAHP